MKIIIVEDEVSSQEYLNDILATVFPQVDIVAVTDNVPEAVKAICTYTPDLVFLDVEIKLGSGFDILEQVKTHCFDVIFTTAYNAFAVEAFRHHALDYLLKPLNSEHVIEAVKRCQQKAKQASYNPENQVALLLQKLQSSSHQKPRLTIPTSEGFEFVDLADIVYAEAKGNYTDLWMKGSNKITMSRKIGELSDTLPGNLFFRIHHSYVVNIQYVSKYYRGRGGYLVLQNNQTLPVSSAKKEEFLNWLR